MLIVMPSNSISSRMKDEGNKYTTFWLWRSLSGNKTVLYLTKTFVVNHHTIIFRCTHTILCYMKHPISHIQYAVWENGAARSVGAIAKMQKYTLQSCEQNIKFIICNSMATLILLFYTHGNHHHHLDHIFQGKDPKTCHTHNRWIKFSKQKSATKMVGLSSFNNYVMLKIRFWSMI